MLVFGEVRETLNVLLLEKPMTEVIPNKLNWNAWLRSRTIKMLRLRKI